MKKVYLIIKREFLVQIKQKSFIIITLFTPIFISILFLFLSSIDTDVDHINDSFEPINYKIGVIDNNPYNFLQIKSYKNIFFTFIKKNKKLINKNFILKEVKKFDALLIIPNYQEKLSSQSLDLYFKNKNNNIDDIINNLNLLLSKKIDILKLKQLGVNKKILNIINHNKLNIKTSFLIKNLSKINTNKTYSNKYLLISIMMYIIMMFILIYGVRIMRSVFEEKNNRIVEIILSSVKPIQLMIGKIFGTALVALIQFIIWIFFLSIIFFIFKYLLVLDDKGFYIKNILEQKNIIFNIFYLKLIFIFIIYFLGGYLLFSAIFAAIGSCIEVDSEPQQFSILASIILLISFYVGISSFHNPNNILVLILSFFPLTSPIVMLSRVYSTIPTWQIILSIFILFFSVFNVMYLASKIYSMNILIHNKKGFFRKIKF